MLPEEPVADLVVTCVQIAKQQGHMGGMARLRDELSEFEQLRKSVG
jgi:hypothetical protein